MASENLDDGLQRRSGPQPQLLAKNEVDQPIEHVKHQSTLDGFESVSSSSYSHHSDHEPSDHTKPVSRYGTYQDILLVYQNEDPSSRPDTTHDVVDFPSAQVGESETGEQQLGKVKAHKRSLAVHLPVGVGQPFDEIKPLNIRSKPYTQTMSDDDIGHQVEDGHGPSQGGSLSEYSWMQSFKDDRDSEVDFQHASADVASNFELEADDDLLDESLANLSDTITEEGILDLADSFSNSHLEPDVPSMNAWPESRWHPNGRVGPNQRWHQEMVTETQLPSETESIDRVSGRAGSDVANLEEHVISPCGRDLKPSKGRPGTPLGIFPQRPIVHKQGLWDLSQASRGNNPESDLETNVEGGLASSFMSADDPDWESVTEQKSSQDGTSAVAYETFDIEPFCGQNKTNVSDSASIKPEIPPKSAKRYQNARKESEKITEFDHKENTAYLSPYDDNADGSESLSALSLEDHGKSRDPFVDAGSDSSACPSIQVAKKAYQHPNPFLFDHAAPSKGSSLLQGSIPMQDLSAKSPNAEYLDSMTDIQRSGMSPTPVSNSAKGKRPLRADDVSCQSSLWLSTVEERESEFNSFRSMRGEICGPDTPYDTSDDDYLGAASSSPRLFPSRVNSAPNFVNGQHKSIASSQMREEHNRNDMISHIQGEPNFNSTTLTNMSPRRGRINQNNNNVGVSTQSSSSNWLRTDKSQQTRSGSGSMQPQTSPESGDGPMTWSELYRLYLPPLGPRGGGPRIMGSPLNRLTRTNSQVSIFAGLGCDQRIETDNSQGVNVWIPEAVEEMSSVSVPNQTYQPSQYRLQVSPNSLFPSPQVHYLRNGQVVTERLPRFLPHPVYGFDCPWDRPNRFVRSESPHLHARDMRDTPEGRARERIYSITFAVFCCLTILMAPLYGHGFLDPLMASFSHGEFRRFRDQDKWFVLVVTYTVLSCVVVGLPVAMIALSK